MKTVSFEKQIMFKDKFYLIHEQIRILKSNGTFVFIILQTFVTTENWGIYTVMYVKSCDMFRLFECTCYFMACVFSQYNMCSDWLILPGHYSPVMPLGQLRHIKTKLKAP